MCLKSKNYKSFYTRVITISMIIPFSIILFLTLPEKDPSDQVIKVVVILIILLLSSFGIISRWIVFGREIELTEKGCIVRFLGYSKLYRWDQMKTKRRVPIRLYHVRHDTPFYNGLVLSCRKVRFPKHYRFSGRGYYKHLPLGYALEVPTTLYPFSLVFIMFGPKIDPFYPDNKTGKKEEEQNKYSGYFADEEQLFSMLHSWGVTLDDE